MSRQKEIKHHLSEAELDDRIDDTDDPELVTRLIFVKNLYFGDTLAEAAERVGKSQPTGGRWADRWNESGVEGLEPKWGDGRPPKLDDGERKRLRELLEEGQPWTTQEVRHLIEEEYNVSYHPNYIYELLRGFGMRYAKPRPKRPERPDNAAEILDDRIDEALDDGDDETVTDGGYVVGFSTRRGLNQPTTASEFGRSASRE